MARRRRQQLSVHCKLHLGPCGERHHAAEGATSLVWHVDACMKVRKLHGLGADLRNSATHKAWKGLLSRVCTHRGGVIKDGDLHGDVAGMCGLPHADTCSATRTS